MAFVKSGRVLKTLMFVAGLCVVGLLFLSLSTFMARHGQAKTEAPAANLVGAKLVPGTDDTLDLSQDVINSLGVRTYQVKEERSHERLRFSGSLLLDSNRMVRVHSRFPGEVVSIGPVKEGADPATDPEGGRPLRLSDKVKKGQLLAVIWSKDVGEKKSDLVNALSQEFLDKAQLERLEKLEIGVVPKKAVNDAKRQVEADVIAVERHERTLVSWRLSDEEIAEVRAEAERIHNGDRTPNLAVEKSWAEVDVRAPFDGVVLEKNVTTGDIVDTSLDLFKIADLSRLGVLANVYEEDLPALEALPPEARRWTIHLKSQPNAPGIPGTFDLIGNVIDPNQHTAAIMGWLDNSDGRLRHGQFITATVELPSVQNEVAIPETALLDEGKKSLVFVSSDAAGRQVTRRAVAVSRRGQDFVYVRSQPTTADREAGCQPLLPGEYVITAGTIELAGALDTALAAASALEERVQ